jgi:hypothetical protein
MNELKVMKGKENIDPKRKHKNSIMRAMMHANYIGNPSRPFEICYDFSII